jgi:hypothetical protein
MPNKDDLGRPGQHAILRRLNLATKFQNELSYELVFDDVFYRGLSAYVSSLGTE